MALQCFPLGDRILGQIVGIQSEGEIAALGNHHRIAPAPPEYPQSEPASPRRCRNTGPRCNAGASEDRLGPPLVDTDPRLVGLVIVGLKRTSFVATTGTPQPAEACAGGSEPAFLPGPASPGELEKRRPRRPLAKGPRPQGGLVLFSEGAKGGMTRSRSNPSFWASNASFARRRRGALREVSVEIRRVR